MVDEILSKVGLFFDDEGNLRLLENDVLENSLLLDSRCNDFMQEINDFKILVEHFNAVLQNLANDVERTKIKALGSRNQLKTISKQRQIERQQYQALIAEKKQTLERLTVQRQSLLRQDAEQNEFLQFL